MVSVRKERRLCRSLVPPSRIPSILEEQRVRSNHECSDKKADIIVESDEKRSNHSEEQSREHSLEGNPHNIGERREALIIGIEAFLVLAKKTGAVEPADTMASPIDRVQFKHALPTPTKQTAMTSMTELYRKFPRVDLQLGQDLELDIEQLELQRAPPGLINRAGVKVWLPDLNAFPDGDNMEWPAAAADDLPDAVDDVDDEDKGLDPDWMISEGESVQEMSNGGPERRIKLDEELPSVKSGRRRLEIFGDEEMSGIMATCRQLVDRKTTDVERMKYIFGSSIASKSHPQAEQDSRRCSRGNGASRITPEVSKSIVQASPPRASTLKRGQAEVASPPRAPTSKRLHSLQSSCTVNNDLDENHPLREPEGSLPHSLYLQLLGCGPEGILLEDLLNHFHSQSLTAVLADDWEDEAKDYLDCNPYFDQVQGYYLLSEFLVHPSPKRSAKEEEKGSPSSTVGFNQDYCGEKNMQIQILSKHALNHMVSTSIEIPAKRGPRSLQAIQAKIIAKYGVQKGGRLCSLRNSRPWQCPMMALEGRTRCAHHHKQFEDKKHKKSLG